MILKILIHNSCYHMLLMIVITKSKGFNVKSSFDYFKININMKWWWEFGQQREAEWRSRILLADRDHNEREAEWRRQLDAATLTTSEVVLERTRLANDKLRLQQEIRRRDVGQKKKQSNLGYFNYCMHS